MHKKLAFFIIMNIVLCLLSFEIRCADNEAPIAERKPAVGWYDWGVSLVIPQTALANAGGEIAERVAEGAAVGADKFTKENIALVDKVMEERIGQLGRVTNNGAEFIGDRFDESIERTLDQGGPLDVAINRTLGQASEQLRPLGHEFAIDLTQNLAKSALVTIKGCFGAVLAYANLIAYLDEQSKTMQQSLNSETTQNVSLTNTQGKYMPHTRLCVATAGAATFVSACLLSYYWIR